MSQQVPPEGDRGYPPPGASGDRPDTPRYDPDADGPDGPFAAPPPVGGAPGSAPAYGAPPYGAPERAPEYGAAPYGSPYGQSPYGQPGPGQGAYGRDAQPRNGLGTAALVLGVLGLLSVITLITFPIGIVLALLAVVLGVIGRRRVKRGEATNGGAALTGLILGALSLLIGAAIVAVFGFAASMFGDEIGSYQECLAQAGQDQAAVAQCNAEFQESVVEQQQG
jgi:hypothetical protein